MLTRRSFIRNALTGIALASAPAVLLPERKIWAVPAGAPVPDRNPHASLEAWLPAEPYDGQPLFGTDRSVPVPEWSGNDRLIIARRGGGDWSAGRLEVLSDTEAERTLRAAAEANIKLCRQMQAMQERLPGSGKHELRAAGLLREDPVLLAERRYLSRMASIDQIRHNPEDHPEFTEGRLQVMEAAARQELRAEKDRAERYQAGLRAAEQLAEDVRRFRARPDFIWPPGTEDEVTHFVVGPELLVTKARA